MRKIIHRGHERGHADLGWLKANYSFSFAGYYDPSKVHFGMLRVLNDDTIAESMGFDMHPHDNMEIVTIPLKGELAHKDSMGHSSLIYPGEIQVMSAGKGITHSEFNNSKQKKLKLFQIWVFPKVRDIEPRYEQKLFSAEGRKNKFQTVVSPERPDDTIWINQNAWFTLSNPEKGVELEYKIKHSGNGLYLLVIEGNAEVSGEKLGRRDALGVIDAESIVIKATEDSELLLIDIPMV